MEILYGILGAGVGAGVMTIIQMMIKRKWAKADRQEEKADKVGNLEKRLAEMDAKMSITLNELSHVKAANKVILADRVKWLGTKYVEAGEIDFEDRRIIRELHEGYHDHCGGNGDYDLLMKAIDKLPLKHE